MGEMMICKNCGHSKSRHKLTQRDGFKWFGYCQHPDCECDKFEQIMYPAVDDLSIPSDEEASR